MSGSHLQDQQQAFLPRAIATEALIDRLRRAVEEGQDLLTYEELSVAVGDDVRRHRGHLATARKAMERDHGIRFQAITNVGIKRATGEEVVQEGRSLIRGIQRRCRTGSQRLVRCVEPDELPPGMVPGYHMQLSVLAMVAHAVSDKTTSAIEQRAADNGARLSLSDTLADTIAALS